MTRTPSAPKTASKPWVNLASRYDYQLPHRYDNQTITVRLHGTPKDAARRFNRTENVRPVAPSDPDFARLYPAALVRAQRRTHEGMSRR